MSIPISMCRINRVIHNERDYKAFVEAMSYNLKQGHWLLLPCEHEPRCPQPTDDELEGLFTRLKKDIPGLREEGE